MYILTTVYSEIRLLYDIIIYLKYFILCSVSLRNITIELNKMYTHHTCNNNNYYLLI